MELIEILRVIRRWLWLIIIIVAVTELALWLGTQSAEPIYAATVRLQISTPQREDVAAYDEYRSISLRDEITVAINNFIELLKTDDVRQRTINQLGLKDNSSFYTIAAGQVRDADFVNVTVEARTPRLAAEIANTQVSIAIAYYGELRAKAPNAERDLFAEQLRVAEEKLWAAEMALADFRTQNDIYSLEAQMSTQRQLLEQLQLERDQYLLQQAATIIPTPDNTILVTATPVIDLVAEVDKLISQRQKELDQFTALAPRYNILDQNVDQARAAYEHLMSKYNEAQLKVTAVQAANFIQVIKPANPPTTSESSWPKLAVLAFAGSLGLGVILAFLLQYVSTLKITGVTVPVSEQKVPSSRKRASRKTRSTDAEQEPIDMRVQPAPTGTDFITASVTVPLNEQKPTSPRKRASRKTRSTDVEQEPVAVQNQYGSTETKVTLDSDNVAD